MRPESNLDVLLKTMKPRLNEGAYVFCTRKDLTDINLAEVLFFFREQEGITIVVTKELADRSGFAYSFVASWITLTVHSALDAVGFTAAISEALTTHNISCNVVAAFHHDHLFVPESDSSKAMKVLTELSGLQAN